MPEQSTFIQSMMEHEELIRQLFNYCYVVGVVGIICTAIFVSTSRTNFVHLISTRKLAFQRMILFFPILFIVGAVFLKITSKLVYGVLFLQEDGPLEYGTSLVYLIAFTVAISIGRAFYKGDCHFLSVLYFSLAAGFMFISMEEISWGQRLLGIETPEILEKYNAQQEITIHNMWGRYVLHGSYILVGFYGVFARMILPKWVKSQYPELIRWCVPSGILFMYFLPIFVLYLYYDYLSVVAVSWLGESFAVGQDHFIVAKDQEPIEFLLGCGFLIFVAMNKYRQKVYGS